MKKEFIDSTLQITEIQKKESAHPLILKFQNELPASGVERVEACGLYMEPGAKSRSGTQLTAAVHLSSMLYVGREVENPYSQNYLLVKNKTTGNVRLIEVGSASLKAVIPDDSLTSTQVEKDDLKQKFGSKRQKRNAEQFKRMKIDVDTVKEQLESSALMMKIEPDDIINQVAEAESSVNIYTPPIDREATDPRQVYKLSDILNSEQLDTLKTSAVILLEEDTYDIEISDYVTDLIGKLRTTSADNKVLNCCTLLYIDCILRLLTGNYKTVCSPKYVICPYSDIINSAVFENFSSVSNNGRTRSQSSKDKAICYIIVLLLIIFDCTITDVEALRLALNIPMKKLQNFVKIIGARMTSGAIQNIVLKLPLTNPPSLKKRDKR